MTKVVEIKFTNSLTKNENIKALDKIYEDMFDKPFGSDVESDVVKDVFVKDESIKDCEEYTLCKKANYWFFEGEEIVYHFTAEVTDNNEIVLTVDSAFYDKMIFRNIDTFNNVNAVVNKFYNAFEK